MEGIGGEASGAAVSRAKTGFLHLEAVGVTCPHCYGPVPHPPEGSEMWAREEYREGDVLPCRDCNEPVRLPKLPASR